MTINVRTGKPIFYECPECKEPARGLVNGHCFKCEQRESERPRSS
jgi:hypothetical protein